MNTTDLIATFSAVALAKILHYLVFWSKQGGFLEEMKILGFGLSLNPTGGRIYQ